jgi:phosphoenolpyruvate carboxykinase (ATP)
LVNTGWSGGPFGQGQRIDIRLTRAMVQAALAGELERGELREDPRFHLWVPRKCPGVPASVLWPRESWKNQGEYDRRAAALAREFAQHFQEAFSGQDIPPEVAAQCPGS